jgi:hypothetical protein
MQLKKEYFLGKDYNSCQWKSRNHDNLIYLPGKNEKYVTSVKSWKISPQQVWIGKVK